MTDRSREPLIEFEIDRPLWSAMQYCECYCVSACCGKDAYELDPASMSAWAQAATPNDVSTALRQLNRLIGEAKDREGKIKLKWVSASNWEEGDPLCWLEDVRECLLEAVYPPQRNQLGTPMIRKVRVRIRALGNDESDRSLGFTLDTPRSGIPQRYIFSTGRIDGVLEIDQEQLAPGETAIAILRFPLPSRVQPALKLGAEFDFFPKDGRKEAEGEILELMGAD